MTRLPCGPARRRSRAATHRAAGHARAMRRPSAPGRGRGSPSAPSCRALLEVGNVGPRAAARDCRALAAIVPSRSAAGGQRGTATRGRAWNVHAIGNDCEPGQLEVGPRASRPSHRGAGKRRADCLCRGHHRQRRRSAARRAMPNGCDWPRVRVAHEDYAGGRLRRRATAAMGTVGCNLRRLRRWNATEVPADRNIAPQSTSPVTVFRPSIRHFHGLADRRVDLQTLRR